MPAPTMEVGPYLLVRPHSGKHLRIYQIYHAAPTLPNEQLGVLWKVAAPELGIPAEWRIRCLDCPAKARPNRPESDSKAFSDRDRALRWLLNHRFHAHPTLSATA